MTQYARIRGRDRMLMGSQKSNEYVSEFWETTDYVLGWPISVPHFCFAVWGTYPPCTCTYAHH